ncbi:hypothetical protein ACJX0J_024727, partial [Zea mays]
TYIKNDLILLHDFLITLLAFLSFLIAVISLPLLYNSVYYHFGSKNICLCSKNYWLKLEGLSIALVKFGELDHVILPFITLCDMFRDNTSII